MDALTELFHHYSISDTLMSNNGYSFVSIEFQKNPKIKIECLK